MPEIRLIPAQDIPNPDLQAIKEAFFARNEFIIPGSALLDHLDDVGEWKERVILNANPKTVLEGWVPSQTYVAQNEQGELVGLLDFRFSLNDFLKDLGHIGYSVLPAHRQKGYATSMLAQALQIARKHDLRQLVLSTRADNEASKKVIRKNGGTFLKSFLHEGRPSEVYRIDLEQN